MAESHIDTIAASDIIIAEAERKPPNPKRSEAMNVNAVLASMVAEETNDTVIIDETSKEPTFEEVMGAENPFTFAMDYLDSVQHQHGDIIAGRQARYIIINFIEATIKARIG